ncbi:MAG TPA: hypothetical protein VJ385_21230 [Fibrobacteria bacterium]|nr:hypothetical protein [Fibrobacteria bacterium]
MRSILIAMLVSGAVALAAESGAPVSGDKTGKALPAVSSSKPGMASASVEDRDLLGRKGKFHFLNPKLRRPKAGAASPCAEADEAGCPGGKGGDVPLFRENFQEGGTAAWTPAAGFWNLSSRDGREKSFRSDSSLPSTVIAGRDDWTDYTVQGQVVLEDGSGEAGLLGRVQGGHHYYALALGRDAAGRKSWFIKMRHHDHIMNLASGRFEYEPGKAYTLRFDLRGRKLSGSVSEPGASAFRALGEAGDASFPQGAIGLHSEGAPARFDALAVDGAAAAGPARTEQPSSWIRPP